MDLSRIFEPGYRAVDLFTDRVTECESLTKALLHHVGRLIDGNATLASTERHNVLAYCGVGGVGKTELSYRLERWLNGDLPDDTEWGAPPRFDQHMHTIRVDFHGSTVVDTADIVLRLRAAVAGIRRRFPAFDVGLTAWWAHARPGQPLPELHTSSGLDVRGQITDTVKDAINDAGAWLGVGPISVRFAARLLDAVRTRQLTNAALDACPQLALVTEAAGRDASPAVAAALAGLLSWDLERLTSSEQAVIVAFTDAVEYVQCGNRLQEKLLHDIVRNTPSILWVMTSRNSLDWADEAAIRRFDSGQVRWPGLRLGAVNDPRQHCVGDLADVDVERFLRMASGHAGIPDLPPEVVGRIRSAAHGLPLYLDLAMAVARSAPKPLNPALFGQPLPELAVRVFTDLPDAERDLARTASLLLRFNAELLAEASGSRHGDAERFCRRSLVSQDDHPIFPHRLHDAVRAAIAAEDMSHPGGWSRMDRMDHAESLLAALHRHNGRLAGQVAEQLDVLEMVAWVAAQHELRPAWLLDALTDLPMARVAERIPEAPDDTWMWHVGRLFQGWIGRTALGRRQYLEELLRTPLPDDVRRTASRFLAHDFRIDNKGSIALPILTRLLEETPDSKALRYEVVRTLWQMRDYTGLNAFLARYPLGNHLAATRVTADLAYDRGDIVAAYEGVLEWARHLKSTGQFRMGLDAESDAVWRGALAGAVTDLECDALIVQIDKFGTTLSLRTALAAKAVCCLADPDSLPALLAESAPMMGAGSGYRGWREWIPMVLYGLWHDDRAAIETARREARANQNRIGPNYGVLDRLFVFAGYEPALSALHPGTLSEQAEADARWRTIFESLLHG